MVAVNINETQKTCELSTVYPAVIEDSSLSEIDSCICPPPYECPLVPGYGDVPDHAATGLGNRAQAFGWTGMEEGDALAMDSDGTSAGGDGNDVGGIGPDADAASEGAGEGKDASGSKDASSSHDVTIDSHDINVSFGDCSVDLSSHDSTGNGSGNGNGNGNGNDAGSSSDVGDR